MSTYTARAAEIVHIKSIEGGTVHWTNGWSTGAFAGIIEQLNTHTDYLLETRNFSLILGLATVRQRSYFPAGEPAEVIYEAGTWLMRKSDEDLEAEHQAFAAELARKREAEWEEHHADWAAREAALPSPLRRRLERFRQNGGHEFETEGWGYELVCCELAALYAESDGVDDETVMAYARENGTSGNQHGFAKAIAKGLTDDPTDQDAVANSPSALAPLTGDLDYSGTRS